MVLRVHWKYVCVVRIEVRVPYSSIDMRLFGNR